MAEDMDLSYHIRILGYRILYLRGLLCPCEIPPTVPSFKQQQGRWACGSMMNVRKIVPELLQNRKIGFKQRLQAFIHLTGYMIQPLMVISFVLSCLAVLLGLDNPHTIQLNALFSASGDPFATLATTVIFVQNLTWGFLGPFITLCTLAPWISLVSTLKIQNIPLVRNLVILLVLLLLGFGISLVTMRGVARGLCTNRAWEWTRTPKNVDLQNKQDWRRSNYQIQLDLLWILKFVFLALGYGRLRPLSSI